MKELRRAFGAQNIRLRDMAIGMAETALVIAGLAALDSRLPLPQAIKVFAALIALTWALMMHAGVPAEPVDEGEQDADI